MSEAKAYDLIVIGAGPAGEQGATTAAHHGKCVALVEKSPYVGGAAANTGTLPSKTLRETALALSGLRARDLHGVDLSLRRAATVADFLRHERHVKDVERKRIRDDLATCQVELFTGAGSFADAHTIRVVPIGGGGDEVLLRGEKILVAIGSSPAQPAEFAFAHPRIWDSDEVLQLEMMPKSLAVVGAGVIGSEYACTFAALGSQVHLIDGRDVLLPFLDLEVSQSLTAAMEKLGITFHWREKVTACTAPDVGPIRITLSSGASVEVEAVLVAAGRVSNTAALDPDKAGLSLAKRGLLNVDEHFRTEIPHIYAAGDVVGFPALASTSMEQARVAVSHAFNIPGKAKVSSILPYGIYTIPEVSMAGKSEGELKGLGVDYVVGKVPYRCTARGKIIGDDAGFLKLIFSRGDRRLLGVHVLGEQASELVHIGLMAMLANAGAELFEDACFNYPTLSELYKLATRAAFG